MKPAKSKKNTVHSFEVDEAVKYGIAEAVLLSNIRHWLTYHKANKSNIHDGYVWTFNSAQAFSELFPYISRRQIARHLKSLCDAGVLMTGNYNERRYDRTTWYTMPHEFSVDKNDQSIDANCPIHWSKMTNGFTENVQPIPNINTNINPNINFLSSLSENEKECYEWAKSHSYWRKKTTTVDRFLTLYRNNQPDNVKQQFAEFQAKKNQCNVGNANTGLNSSNTQNGGNHATQNQFNATRGATGGKLSAVDRVRVANGLPTQREENERRRQQQQQQERVIN